MPPFNKRQVGYIKAIAGIGQHKSFITYNNNVTYDSSCIDSQNRTNEGMFWDQPPKNLFDVGPTSILDVSDKSIGAVVLTLDNVPLTIDHTDNSTDINGMSFERKKFEKALGPVHPMGLLTQVAYPEANENKLASTRNRVGEDFYLESTHIKWRFTMPDFTVPSGKQPHHEYRWIVFRQRKPTLGPGTDPSAQSVQWLNWNYDLFNGYNGRPIGPSGFRRREQFDGEEDYIATPVTQDFTVDPGEGICSIQPKLTADDLMTLPVNEADYVVMRDERFFLGAEHGKSHYETVTRFDWSDPGSTDDSRMIQGLDESKNYRWFFLLIGTTNDSVQPSLNISVRGTTAITSA